MSANHEIIANVHSSPSVDVARRGGKETKRFESFLPAKFVVFFFLGESR